jgi:PKD repeat protein
VLSRHFAELLGKYKYVSVSTEFTQFGGYKMEDLTKLYPMNSQGRGNGRRLYSISFLLMLILAITQTSPLSSTAEGDIWIQTSQADFETGTKVNVDAVSDPGNVTLEYAWTKYSSNPVMDIGSPGSWDDLYIENPFILKDGATYKMWFSGTDSVSQLWKIGYATSPDGITWTKYGPNPVVTLGAGGSWDDSYVWAPTVIKDGGTYKMWYSGSDGSNYRIGFATSPDGIAWTKYAGNPVLDLGAGSSWDDYLVYIPSVVYDGLAYHMWYSGDDGSITRIGYASSVDGITWMKSGSNPVLELGSPGSWDSGIVWMPDVVPEGNVYRMWYGGDNDPVTLFDNKIGFATSSDGVNWVRFSGNPVLEQGPGGSWDDFTVGSPSYLKDGNSYRIWYSGGDGTNKRIGLASANYQSSGTLTSEVFDSNYVNTNWDEISWIEFLYPSTNITLSTRTGDTSPPDASWSPWSSEHWDQTGSQILSPPARYIQYRATLTTTNPLVTPILSEVSIKYFLEPVASAGQDIAINEDDIALFDGSGSTGAILYYNWSFGDGTYDNGSNLKPTHQYSREGVYMVTLNVTDDIGNWDTDIILVFVNNLPPKANAGPDKNVNESDVVVFNGSLSTDTPSDIPNLVYTWYFGDGFVDSGKTTNHTFSNAGIYIVTLVVEDDNGETSSDTLTVTVNALPSVLRADAGRDMSAKEDDAVIFDGSGSTGNVQYYNWSFGDGTFANGTNPNPTHIYTHSGTYNVFLNVSDGSGNWDKESNLVFVNNVPPIASAGPDRSMDEGTEAIFNGSSSSDTPSDLPTLVYTWYFGDGSVGSGITTSHVYFKEGSYIVTLVVMDDNGDVDSDSLIVNVSDVPPEVNSAPVLENPSATADGIFQVIYKDEDGDLPNEVLLILDGVSYEMALKGGDDFVAGVEYELDLPLESGRSYSYWFKAIDKNDTIGMTSVATLSVPPEEEGVDWIFILLVILLIISIILLILSSISLRRKGQEKEEAATPSDPTPAAPVSSTETSGEDTSEAVEGASLNCNSCGAKLDPESTVCPSCDASVEPPPPPP